LDKLQIALDFDPEYGAPTGGSANLSAQLFGDLIGCEEVTRLLLKYRSTFLLAKQQGIDPLEMLSIIFKFVGAPGQCVHSAPCAANK
jgi:hypothetical protein